MRLPCSTLVNGSFYSSAQTFPLEWNDMTAYS